MTMALLRHVGHVALDERVQAAPQLNALLGDGAFGDVAPCSINTCREGETKVRQLNEMMMELVRRAQRGDTAAAQVVARYRSEHDAITTQFNTAVGGRRWALSYVCCDARDIGNLAEKLKHRMATEAGLAAEEFVREPDALSQTATLLKTVLYLGLGLVAVVAAITLYNTYRGRPTVLPGLPALRGARLRARRR
jgi:hypothetical protein